MILSARFSRLSTIVAASAFLAFSLPAYAQDVSESHLKAAHEAIKSIHATDDFDNILPQAAAALQAHPDLKGIYTTHSNAAVGTSSAVIGAGLGGKVKIIAYDADPQQVRDLKAGVYDALVVQSPYIEGYESVKLVTQILRGEVDASKVDKVMYPPMVVATRDNLDTPEVKKNLYVDACP